MAVASSTRSSKLCCLTRCTVCLMVDAPLRRTSASVTLSRLLSTLIKVFSSSGAGGTFITVFSQSYIHANDYIYPLCVVRVEMKTELLIYVHWCGTARSRRGASPTAHRGEIVGSLPHRDLMQVQGNATGTHPQKRTTTAAQSLPNVIRRHLQAKQKKIVCLSLSTNPTGCHLRRVSMWRHKRPSVEWTSVTAWLIWLHTLRVSPPSWRSHLDNEGSLLACWSTPAISHALQHHSQRMLRAGLAIMAFITGAAGF